MTDFPTLDALKGGVSRVSVEEGFREVLIFFVWKGREGSECPCLGPASARAHERRDSSCAHRYGTGMALGGGGGASVSAAGEERGVWAAARLGAFQDLRWMPPRRVRATRWHGGEKAGSAPHADSCIVEKPASD